MAQDKILGEFSLSESATVRNGNLQSILDGFSAPTGGNWSYEGGILRLGRGDFYGNLVLNRANTVIEGEGLGTVIHGSISIQSQLCELRRLCVRAEGAAYGIKLFRPTTLPGSSGVPRCKLENLFVGATSEGAGNGPVVGLWMDGAILTSINDCTFAFCTGSGIYSDTSDPAGAWSTNVNIFRNCTMNGNGRYGYEGVVGAGAASQQGNQFFGGNMESNTLGAVLASGQTNLTFRGVDFENGKTVSDLLTIGTCLPVTVEDCNFVTLPATAQRVGIFSSCQGVRFVGNRFSGFTDERTVIFDENSSGVVCHGNVWADGITRYIHNRSAM